MYCDSFVVCLNAIIKTFVMKKTVLLFLLFIAAIWKINAQLSEDFEGSFPPAGWSITDGENGKFIDWESSTDSFSGSKAAFISFDDELAGATEDWLISPQFTPNTSNNVLTFYQKQDLESNYGSTYTVRVKNITKVEDDVVVDSQSESDFGVDYELHTVDLSIYDGDNIQIAFVLEQDWGDSWYIDKVSTVNPIVGVPNCALNHSPNNTQTNVANLAGDVLLSWDAPDSGAVPNAYRVQVGLTSDVLTLFDLETGNTNYKLTGLEY